MTSCVCTVQKVQASTTQEESPQSSEIHDEISTIENNTETSCVRIRLEHANTFYCVMNSNI